VRDILGFAKTAKEAKKIISKGNILVDSKVRRDERFLVGMMDVISIDETKKSYRLLPSPKGLFLHPIDVDEATFKLFRIEDKTVVKGGRTDLNFHDGTSMLIEEDNTFATGKVEYHTLDVLKLSIPGRELLGHTKLVVGAPTIVIGGKNMGTYGIISTIEKQADKKRRDLLVTLKDIKGQQFQTILDFVFVLGETESSISLPEVD